MQKITSHPYLAQVNEAATIFLKAANYIRTYGWQEKGMGFHKGPRCSMGALESACHKKKLDPTVASLMYHVLYQKLGGINLTEFNAKAKTGEDVALLFEQTAHFLQQ